MKKGTFEDLLPQETVERMLLSNVSVGEVFRMHLGKEENVDTRLFYYIYSI